MARGKRFSPEQIIATLRQIEVQLAQGKGLALACKEAGIAEQGRDRGLARSLQSYPPPLSPRLPTTRARHPRFRSPPTHTKHHAVVSHNPVQNPGQVTPAFTSVSPRMRLVSWVLKARSDLKRRGDSSSMTESA